MAETLIDTQAEVVRRPRGRPSVDRVVVPVYLRRETAARLLKLSELRDQPMSGLVRDAVVRMLAEAGL